MPEEKLPVFKTEHFKFYRVEIDRRPERIPVLLRGQFEPPRIAPRRHAVILLRYFGVPVSKNEGRIRNRKTHLAWYELEGAREPVRTVGALNQFGKIALTLGDPRMLLAPALKQTTETPTPADLLKDVSHFKGYRVLRCADFKPRTVVLQDQFDPKPIRVQVDSPAYFCVPVEKKAGESLWPSVNPEEHLVIYPITFRAYEEKRAVWDQFKGGRLWNFRSYYLAVPTLKSVVRRGAVDLRF
jgi:hypothetical protein